MPYFRYIARDKMGKKHVGNIRGDSKAEVYEKIHQKNLRIMDLKEVKPTFWNQEIQIGKIVKKKDFILYLQQFATLLEAGISIVDATHMLGEQTESKGLRRVLQQVESDIRNGMSLSHAYGKHPKVFNGLCVTMIEAGEATGEMDLTFKQLANYFEKQYLLQQKVKAALTYPAILGVISLFVVLFLLTFVVPSFVVMFESFHISLPLITLLVIESTKWLQHNGYILILFTVLCYILFFLLMKNIHFKRNIYYLLLKVPIIGKLLQKTLLARFARTLASLLYASVPILEALMICKRVIGNVVMQQVLDEASRSLEKGGALSNAIQGKRVFPPLVSQMIRIGERTGTLDDMLKKVADFYEKEVDNISEQLKILIEPLMIVVLAVIIGGIMLSVIIPLLTLYNHIS